MIDYSNTFTRSRSEFYVKIFDNKDSISILANKFTICIINTYFNKIVDLSPTKWKECKSPNCCLLWIPENRYIEEIIEDFICWCKNCNDCLWVHLNKNIKAYFNGDELDFCICSDLNFSVDQNGKFKRTEIGKAEYSVKYAEDYSKNNIQQIVAAVDKCLQCLTDLPEDFFVTTLPATVVNQDKLSWKLASVTKEKLGGSFLNATVISSKPQMKETKINDKIIIWRNLYKYNQVLLEQDIRDKLILIVDDLYQSGASMWCYAEYLKQKGAKNIIAVSIVKSLRDSDNL